MKVASLKRWISILALASLVSVAAFVEAHPASAASPIRVTTWKDELDSTPNATCSLREAVISANDAIAFGGCSRGSIGADEIVLPPDLKDELGSERYFEVSRGSPGEDQPRQGDLDILDMLTIRGAGRDLTTIASSNHVDRIFHIIDLGSKVVTIEGVTIRGGSSVDKGGGIYNFGSTLILRNVNITGNQANQWGGGVRNKIDLERGIGSTLTIFDAIILANYSGGDGGGIDNDGSLYIANSLISTNQAVVKGGGISNNSQLGYQVKITNTTITQNIGADGAGVSTAGEDVTFLNCTIYNNIGTSPSTAIVGVVVRQGDGNQVTFNNTIIAGHEAPRQNCAVQALAVVYSNGHNLEDAATCGLNTDGVADDLVNTPPGLDSFGAYGSDTQLYGLLPGSPAIDSGADEGCPSTDQRGVNFGRPADGNGDGSAVCDIGAFESAAVPAKTVFLPNIFQ